MLHLRTYNFMPLPLVTVALFISNNISGLFWGNLLEILKTSIISSVIDKLRNVGMHFFSLVSVLSLTSSDL